MGERVAKAFIYASAFLLIVATFGIVMMLVKEGIPLFKEVSPLKFLLGKSWRPTYSPPEFGVLPLVIGTAVVTIGALLVGVPLGLASAIYLAFFSSHRLRNALKPILEVLASIPSVVYGFFGMVVLAPSVKELFSLPVGLNAFTASIVLGIMIVPLVGSVAEDAISMVPRELLEASYALGATKWRTVMCVVIPTAWSGVFSSILLGMGRAIGETMTVLMVAGGAAQIPSSIFDPVRTMTATIAAEMGEAPFGSLHYHALFAIGMILFFITVLLNFIVERFGKRRTYL
ncbi:MAG: phosphate ABC transporter permease subunit PstC [Synergistetes bacterium]|uniref:Phosphate transport system permease protein n=1 Tax=Thermotoga petrophila TaxID=93929 RepID=A0A101ER37_9THEM|nr:MAG: Phosphate ABC transporter membrane protein 1, PhoT family [Thermotoga petrophila]MBC7332063.1 phosphate ABC transporter permease subunit PstC [Synergistota bacterium]MDK2870928.1 phosphate transport system permease protein [bacterium]